MWGADAGQLLALAVRLEGQAEEIDRAQRALTGRLRVAPWQGPGADRYRQRWEAQDRRQVLAAAGFLRDAARELRSNAAQQEQASAGTTGHIGGPGPAAAVASGGPDAAVGGSGSGPRVIDRESFVISAGAGVVLFGADREVTVVKERLSDGTVRVTLSGQLDGDVGIDISDIIGLVLPVGAGLEVGGGVGMSVSFIAYSDAAADDFFSWLKGTAAASSGGPAFWGKAVVDGDTDLGSAWRVLRGGGITGIEVESVTLRHASASVTGHGQAINEFSADATRWNETTYTMDGRQIERTVIENVASTDGWNRTEVASRQVMEVERDAHTGEPLRVAYSEESSSRLDTRSGFEKARDGLIGIFPVIEFATIEQDARSHVTQWEYDVSALPADHPVRIAALEDDRLSLVQLHNGNPAHLGGTRTEQSFSGEERGSEFSLFLARAGRTGTTESSPR